MNFSALFFALLSVLSVSAKTFNVAVGDNNGLVYNPSSISGAVAGDQIIFTFTSKNHTVTQSTFTSPCVKASSTAIDSGFQPAAKTPQPTFTITLNPQTASAPLWFFCAQTNPANHCHAGMVFAINPTATKTFTQYQANAKNSANNSSSTTSSTNAPKGTSGTAATVHTVIVGQNSTLTFNPPSIQALAGDTIAFTFVSKNHSATQSTFTSPCTRAPGGVDSGFQFIPPNSTTAAQWSITLDAASAANPLWFYCAQTNPANHCHAGMVFAINPTANKTFAQFKNNAINSVTSSSGTPSSTGTPSSIGTTSSTGSSASTGAPSSGTDGSGISTGSGASSSTATSTASASNGAAPALRSSMNAGLILSIVGLVASLSF